MTSASDTWNPDQYAIFRDERAQPFLDLLDLVSPVPGGRVVDLGCGPGELTRVLHERLEAAETIGLDASTAMLAKTTPHAGDGLTFVQGDIATWGEGASFDVVFSNAALQWVPDHDRLFPRLAAMVAPGGQFAVQIPANQDHPSQSVARALAVERPFATALTGPGGHSPPRPPEWYAEMLYRAGFVSQQVRLQVYAHLLDGPEAVVEWMRGSLLTDYQRRLTAEQFAAFDRAYAERLLATLPDERPYLFTFRRLLMWGRAPSTGAER